MEILAGKIGDVSNTANVHGGGYGESASVEGNISLILDKENDNTGCTIFGDVYGGGALGKTMSEIGVTMNAGQISGSLYGAGLGETAEAAGNTYVRMAGGIVHGNVFGGGNAARVLGDTGVGISGGEVKNNVYGGGNQAEVTGKTYVVIGK